MFRVGCKTKGVVGFALCQVGVCGDGCARQSCGIDFSTTTMVEWEFLCGRLCHQSRFRGVPYGPFDHSEIDVSIRVFVSDYLDDLFLVCAGNKSLDGGF